MKNNVELLNSQKIYSTRTYSSIIKNFEKQCRQTKKKQPNKITTTAYERMYPVIEGSRSVSRKQLAETAEVKFIYNDTNGNAEAMLYSPERKRFLSDFN